MPRCCARCRTRCCTRTGGERAHARRARTERALLRLTAAIAEGGDVPAVVEGVRAQERQREELQERRVLSEPAPALDRAALREELRGYVRD